jgi:DNA-directed RNA polymerase subunit RPC12/RpoP
MVEHEYTKEIVCPYCGYEQGDSWEYDGECDELECAECGKKFHYSRDISVSYSTSCDCIENGNKHNWAEWEYIESDEDVLTKELHEEVNDFYIRECTKCDKQEFISFKDMNKD